MATCSVDITEQDEKIHESEGEIGGHDVPQPVHLSTRTRDAIDTEGVCQRIVTWQTASTKNTCLVQVLACFVIE